MRAASSSSRSAAGTSQGSISSGEALRRLKMMEQKLAEEMGARVAAESAIQALVEERRVKDEALAESKQTQRKLEAVLIAVNAIVDHPQNTALLKCRSLGDRYRQRKDLHDMHPPPRCFLDALVETSPDPNPQHTIRTSYCTDYKGGLHFHSLKTIPKGKVYPGSIDNNMPSDKNTINNLAARRPKLIPVGDKKRTSSRSSKPRSTASTYEIASKQSSKSEK